LATGNPPASPSGLAALAGNRQVLLSWQPVFGARNYQLKRAASSAGPFSIIAGGITSTNFLDPGAINGATNYYVISSVNACGSSADSPAIAVFLPLPSLGAGLGSNGFTMTWQGWANDWQLQSTTNLAPPVVWSPVTNAAVTSNGQFIITVPLGSEARFFRLASP